MATAAEMRRRREALGHRIKELLREGYTLEQAAKSEGLTIKTCSAYWALAQAPAAVRDLYRDGRLPLDAVAMIAENGRGLAAVGATAGSVLTALSGASEIVQIGMMGMAALGLIYLLARSWKREA